MLRPIGPKREGLEWKLLCALINTNDSEMVTKSMSLLSSWSRREGVRGQRRSIFYPGWSFLCDIGQWSCDLIHCMSLFLICIALVGSPESSCDSMIGPDHYGLFWDLMQWAVSAITRSLLMTQSCTLLCIFKSLLSERLLSEQDLTWAEGVGPMWFTLCCVITAPSDSECTLLEWSG